MIPAAHRRNELDNKEAAMKIEFLSFLEWSLQLSILLNVFMAGLCGLYRLPSSSPRATRSRP